MNLKPFDLQKALQGEPVVTKIGKKVLAIAHFPRCYDKYKVYAHIEGYSAPDRFLENGKYVSSVMGDHDLFMAPKTKKLYIPINKKIQPGVRFHTTGNAFIDRYDAENITQIYSPEEYEIKEVEIEI